MKTRKLGVVLLALLLASMAMVPIVSAQNITTEVNSSNHLNIHIENRNITTFIAYDITSKANLSSYNIQKPEELWIPEAVNKFDVATFDHTLFNNQLKSGKEITISLGGKDYQAELPRMNFENISDGVDSYHGSFSGEKNSDILITTGEKVFIARITLENETLWIIPVEPRERMELSQSPLHIIYNSKDLKPTKFTIDNGTVKINPELSPSVSQSKLSILQQTPPDQNVTVDILVVTDNIFYNNSYWKVPAQNIIAEANRVLSKNDIKVILRPHYDDSRRTIFSSHPKRTTKPHEALKDIYPTSDLDFIGADIAIYLGGYDIPMFDEYLHLNEYWNAQGLSWGFNTSSEFRRYSWAQMVDDFPGYTANPHGQQSVSIHEIGHLFGAHHNDVPDEPQYARAATFGDFPNDKKTVMWTEYSDTASLTEFSSNDCLYLLNYPNGDSQWYPMGDTNHDNSRRISETRDIVAEYSHNDKTGVYRNGSGFYLKTDNSDNWNPETDRYLAWDNVAGDRPIAGDWNGDGIIETGVYRPSAGFYLKIDPGSAWNPPTDLYLAWDNAAGDLPIAGDWNMDGRDETGVYRPGAGFYLKMDQTGTWYPSTDLYLAWDNAANDRPIAGDWNMDGRDETGVYRPGYGFYLKMDQGSTWNPATDRTLLWDNVPQDLPIAGDWNGDGMIETGVYRPGSGFYLKMDQTGTWHPSTDIYLAWDNTAGDLPLAGNF